VRSRDGIAGPYDAGGREELADRDEAAGRDGELGRGDAAAAEAPMAVGLVGRVGRAGAVASEPGLGGVGVSTGADVVVPAAGTLTMRASASA